MRHLSLPHFIIIAILFWGLPGIFVAGQEVVLYIIAAVLPVWWFARKRIETPPALQQRFGATTCVILAGGAIAYLIADALFGQKLFQQNLFLVGSVAIDAVVDQANLGVGEGRGVVALLGTLTMLLPFCLIDVAERAPRYGRWALWCVAILLLFYEVTSSRAMVLLAVMSIVLARTSNWRRIGLAGALALGAFTVASALRGDYSNPGSPLAAGMAGPYINLLLMMSSHCGSAPWYSFLFEFLKKFLPGFLIPKNVFSFNIEMSLCIYPTVDNNVVSVSIFTWLGEIFYYKPSILTALVGGALMGGMGWLVDRQLVKNGLFSSRMYAGFACIMMLRSRILDLMSFLIAQAIFLLVWPYFSDLARSLRFLAVTTVPGGAASPHRELS